MNNRDGDPVEWVRGQMRELSNPYPSRLSQSRENLRKSMA
jgi:hypothetical protein